MNKTFIEILAEKYSNGDIVAEFTGRMEQFANWEGISRDELIIASDKSSLTITIDGSSPAYMKGDALDWLDETDLFNLLKVSIFLKADLTILPATNKKLSIQFYWSRY